MKLPALSLKEPRLTTLILSTCLVIGGVLPLAAQDAQLVARPLTPNEIHDYSLPADTPTSGGLFTVGIGEPVYLEVLVDSETESSGVSWSIEEAPDSRSGFTDTPLTPEVPPYSIADRGAFEVAGRTRFVPESVGRFLIKAEVNTDSGLVTVEEYVTGAEYVGMGTMLESEPNYPQCALCHEEQSLDYMETGHASFFERAIDGEESSHYGENCISCHTLGQAAEVDNGGFASRAENIGWVFPDVLEPGNWDAMPEELKAMSNIQCEHCHGAGSEHHGIAETTSVSFNAGDCGQCHDEEPYHTKNMEWDISAHATATRYPTGEGRGSCVECHSAIGFVDTLDGVEEPRVDYEAISCAACHDPHDASNPHQVRTMENVVLENGIEVTDGGTGKVCMNCHKSRRDGESYAVEYHSHFGPHYGPQTDMLQGTNAVEYGQEIVSSTHIYAVENSCSSCHMEEIPQGEPGHTLAGGHTFNPVFDNDTPDDTSDDIDIVAGCTDCHGPIESFDMKKIDYNNDGVVEGVQTEIKKIMKQLALKLPPMGEPTVEVTEEYTSQQTKAAFNYLFVEEDGSMGIHNTRYTVGILKAAISDLDGSQNHALQGENVPVGGEWYFSPWFGFYAPLEPSPWVYHIDHKHLYVTGSPDRVLYYETENNRGWYYTSSSAYPRVYSYKMGAWLHYAGNFDGTRWFFNYKTRAWLSY